MENQFTQQKKTGTRCDPSRPFSTKDINLQISLQQTPPKKSSSLFTLALNTTTNAIIGTQKIAFAADELIDDLA